MTCHVKSPICGKFGIWSPQWLRLDLTQAHWKFKGNKLDIDVSLPSLPRWIMRCAIALSISYASLLPSEWVTGVDQAIDWFDSLAVLIHPFADGSNARGKFNFTYKVPTRLLQVSSCLNNIPTEELLNCPFNAIFCLIWNAHYHW